MVGTFALNCILEETLAKSETIENRKGSLSRDDHEKLISVLLPRQRPLDNVAPLLRSGEMLVQVETA